MSRFDKVLVLGIDGLDPGILGMLRGQGVVPNFERLRRRGSGGELRTVAPAQSPVVWTSLATGTNPGRHGVFDFIHRDPKRPLPFLSVCQNQGGLLRGTRYTQPRRNAAFWDVLTERGVPVTAVRWPVTFPAERIDGRMLSGLGVPGIRGTLGHYTLYAQEGAPAPGVDPARLVRLSAAGERVDTVIKGPMVRGLRGTSHAEVPLLLQRTAAGITVRVGEERFDLAEGDWSDWVALKFGVGALKTVSGMAKFRLVSRAPLKLYMSPLEPDPREPAFEIASPEGYAGELAQQIGLFHTLGMPEDTKALNEGALSEEAFLDQCREVTDERVRMFWHEFERFEAGALAFVFDTSDRIQHMFWRQNEFSPDGTVAELCPAIREHYLLMDRFLGELLQEIDDKTGLIVLSDHGFTDYKTNFDLNAWLAEEGFMKLKANPGEMEEDETALYRIVDWSRTVAYGCGFTSLYLNMKGREGNGIVEPDEAHELAAEIAKRMKAYRDGETGARPVARADLGEDIYSGSEMPGAPDVVVGTSPGYRGSWQTAVGGVAAQVLSPNERHWSGDHIVAPAAVPGTLLSNLPLRTQGAGALDVAPTVLAMLGIEPPAECEGRSLLADETA